MAGVKCTENSLLDAELAAQLTKLWPHREHEAPPFAGILCSIGLHRWRRLDLAVLVPNRDILYCFCCSKVRIDGVVYEA
jgi:hypothetical protein